MFADRLKALRQENNFTQKQISDILGLDRSTYAYYELARTRPDIDTLVMLAKIFKVSTDYLLLGDQENKGVSCVNEEGAEYVRTNISFDHLGDLSKDERELILYYRMLNNNAKSEIRNIAKEKYAEIAPEYTALLKK